MFGLMFVAVVRRWGGGQTINTDELEFQHEVYRQNIRKQTVYKNKKVQPTTIAYAALPENCSATYS